MNKEEIKERNRNNKEYLKAYRKAHRQHSLEYGKAYYQAHKEERKAYQKEYRKVHKEEAKAYMKVWFEAHKEERKEYLKEYQKAYYQAHKEEKKAYMKSDVNSLGQMKQSIRVKSNRYLKKYGTKIEGYQIHHCCTYTEPYKFIYCSKEFHRLIHSYLRQHNIDADSDHYEQIKHLLDDSVVKYNIE